MQKVVWGIGFFNQAKLSLVTGKVIGKRYSKAIAQDVPDYLEFDGQSYPAVADPTRVSTFSFAPLLDPKEGYIHQSWLLRLWVMGPLNSTVDFTVWINVSQRTQNKWQEDILVFRAWWCFWKTGVPHSCNCSLSVAKTRHRKRR